MKTLEILARQIPDHSNYFVTESGRVFSTMDGTIREMRLIRSHDSKKNYRRVQLYNQKNKTSKWEFVHRLVGITWVKNDDNKPFINHKDGDQSNNHASNLEWVSHQENINHKINILKKHQRGENNGQAKIGEKEVREIRKTKIENKNISNKKIGEKYGITGESVGNIVRGLSWKHIE